MTAAIVGASLPIAGPAPDALDDAGWHEAMRMLVRERGHGAALASIRDGVVEASRAQRDDLEERHEEALVQVLRRDAALVELDGALVHSGVRTVVLKGPAAAHRLYADPAMRLYGDLDLLVAPDDLGLALHVIAALDGRPHRVIRDTRRSGIASRGVACALPGGIEVDLHTSVARGGWMPCGTLPRLPVDPAPLLLAGHAVRCLAPAAMGLQAALTLAFEGALRRLVPAVDVLLAARRADEQDDSVWQLAERLGVLDPVARGFDRARAVGVEAGVTSLPLPTALRDDPLTRTLWWASTHTSEPARLVVRAHILWNLPTWRARRLYVAGRSDRVRA